MATVAENAMVASFLFRKNVLLAGVFLTTVFFVTLVVTFLTGVSFLVIFILSVIVNNLPGDGHKCPRRANLGKILGLIK